MVRVGEFSNDVCDRLKLKVSMKVTITKADVVNLKSYSIGSKKVAFRLLA
jgi:hypothetical protein